MIETYINSNAQKIPVTPQGINTDHTNRANWISFEAAHRAQVINGLNVSYVLHGGPVWCLDIDKCISDGIVGDMAQALVTLAMSYSTYIEVSTSGTGLHIWGNHSGEIPEHTCKNTALKIELYTDERHVILGRCIPSSPLESITDVLGAAPSNELFNTIVAGYFAATDNKASIANANWLTGARLTGQGMLDEIVTRAPAKKGNIFTGGMSLVELLNIDEAQWSASDKSSLDMSLLNNLAFHCGKHHEQMELAYRATNLASYRQGEQINKLERSAGGGMTYLHRSICQAVADCKETYTTQDDVIEDAREKINRTGGESPESPSGYRLRDFYAMYNGEGTKFYHVPSGNELSKGCFKDAFRIGPFEFEQAATDRILAGKSYHPGEPLVYEENGIRLLNTWVATPEPEPITPDDVALIDEYFTAICPVDIERAHLKQWCAHIVQRPKVKILHAVLMHGFDTGTGKSTLGVILSKAVGVDNTARINNNTITDQFNGWLCRATFGWCDELNTSMMSSYKKYQVSEMIKEWITNRSLPIREMYQSTVNAQNWVNGFLFTSNDDESLMVDEKDRRFFVINIVGNMLTQQLINNGSFTRLNHGLTGGQFVSYFNNIDITGFNPSLEAPITVAKTAMIENTLDDVGTMIADEIDGGNLASDDYIFVGKLAEREGVSSKSIVKHARRLGYKKFNSGGLRYWAKPGQNINHAEIKKVFKLC